MINEHAIEYPRMLISAETVQEEVAKLSRNLEEAMQRQAPNDPLMVVGIMDGALVFMADLTRRLAFPMHWTLVHASSYGNSHKSNGSVALEWIGRPDFNGRRVLILDDIVDSGLTMKSVMNAVMEQAPERIWSAALLLKKINRTVGVRVDYHCFEIPDVFVVGYGLDYAGRYRNLPYIGVVDKPHLEHN
jgi:hypoxanthine phosphoribosyltransferase